jgi:WD40 repeat protein
VTDWRTGDSECLIETAHTGAVTGVAWLGDSVSFEREFPLAPPQSFLFVSCGEDGLVKFWSAAECLGVANLGGACLSVTVNRRIGEGDMPITVAAGMANGSIAIIDLPPLFLRTPLHTHQQVAASAARRQQQLQLQQQQQQQLLQQQAGLPLAPTPAPAAAPTPAPAPVTLALASAPAPQGPAELNFRTIHNAHRTAVISVCLHPELPDVMASAGLDTTVRVWSVKTGDCRHVLRGHTKAVSSVRLAGFVVVTGSEDRLIRLWNLETGQTVKTLSLVDPSAFVESLEIDQGFIMAGTKRGRIYVFSLETYTCIRTIDIDKASVSALSFNKSVIAVGASDGAVLVIRFLDEKTRERQLQAQKAQQQRMLKHHKGGNTTGAGGGGGGASGSSSALLGPGAAKSSSDLTQTLQPTSQRRRDKYERYQVDLRLSQADLYQPQAAGPVVGPKKRAVTLAPLDTTVVSPRRQKEKTATATASAKTPRLPPITPASSSAVQQQQQQQPESPVNNAPEPPPAPEVPSDLVLVPPSRTTKVTTSRQPNVWAVDLGSVQPVVLVGLVPVVHNVEGVVARATVRAQVGGGSTVMRDVAEWRGTLRTGEAVYIEMDRKIAPVCRCLRLDTVADFGVTWAHVQIMLPRDEAPSRGDPHLAASSVSGSVGVMGSSLIDPLEAQRDTYIGEPLGLQKGGIPDGHMVASTEKSADTIAPHARLHRRGGGGAWCARVNNRNQFIEVNLGRVTELTGIATQGRDPSSGCNQWVTAYTLSTSADGQTWRPIPGASSSSSSSPSSSPRVFAGNANPTGVVAHPLVPVHCRFVRLYPVSWHEAIALRLELYGQQTALGPALGMHSGAVLDKWITASSHAGPGYEPEHGRLGRSSGKGGWSAGELNRRQFLQVSLPEPARIVGVATQGKNPKRDGNTFEWVTHYLLLHSLDGAKWTTYTEGGVQREFLGNCDGVCPVFNNILKPLVAKYIRFVPTAWFNKIAMRVELYGEYVAVGAGISRETPAPPNASSTSLYLNNNTNNNNPAEDEVSMIRQSVYGSARDLDEGPLVAENSAPAADPVGSPPSHPPRAASPTEPPPHHHHHHPHPPPLSPDPPAPSFADPEAVVAFLAERAVVERGALLPLGIAERRIADVQMRASSSLPGMEARHARLLGTEAWCPDPSDERPYLEVDLGVTVDLIGVATQGRPRASQEARRERGTGQYVMSYAVKTSLDGRRWAVIRTEGGGGGVRVFSGNSDRSSVVPHELPAGTRARFVRVYPATWFYAPAMRLELYGCLPTEAEIGRPVGLLAPRPLPIVSSVRYSSGERNARGVWVPSVSDAEALLVVSLAGNLELLAVQTAGTGFASDAPAAGGEDGGGGWVSRFAIETSDDGRAWFTAGEFLANTEPTRPVLNAVPKAPLCRYLRLRPLEWVGQVALALELFGRFDHHPGEGGHLSNHHPDGPGHPQQVTVTTTVGLPALEADDEDLYLRSAADGSRSVPLREFINVYVEQQPDGHVPHSVEVDFGSTQSVTGFFTQQLTAKPTAGHAVLFHIYSSPDGIHWRPVSTALEISPCSVAAERPYHGFDPHLRTRFLRISGDRRRPIASPALFSLAFLAPPAAAAASAAAPLRVSVSVDNAAGELVPATTFRGTALGVQDGHLSAITATSEIPGYPAKAARLASPDGCWAAVVDSRAGASTQFQLDAGSPANFTAVAVQAGLPVVLPGAAADDVVRVTGWITFFRVATSLDGQRWSYVGTAGTPKVFRGCLDADSITIQAMPAGGAMGRYLRILPLSHHGGHLALRCEIYGERGVDAQVEE